ncbi:MAG: hypothetical protein BWY09_02317 [Candidatus Hydrogenedentes bacterium ADurb.Bin179]|nr:MAG: hypothetical protein BWY09_02317 [Candidatus Hydrogenedentes bacterium ADurb.Bin179]
MQYGQDIATNDYQNFLNRYYRSLQPLQTLSGMGQNAVVQGGQFGERAAERVAGLQVDKAAARASSYGKLGDFAGEAIGGLFGSIF